MKLEREAKQSSEMVDRRENEASSNQMKADGREIDRTSGPFRAGFQKNLANQTSSLKTSLSRSALKAEKYTVIALRDLDRYIDRAKSPDDGFSVIETRKSKLENEAGAKK